MIEPEQASDLQRALGQRGRFAGIARLKRNSAS